MKNSISSSVWTLLLMSLLCQSQPFMMVPAASLLISMLHLYTPVFSGSFILLIVAFSKYLKKKSELRNCQFGIVEKIRVKEPPVSGIEKNQNKGQFHLFQKPQRTTGFHEITSRSLGGYFHSFRENWEPWLYSKAQYGHIKTNTYLTYLHKHGIPWSTLSFHRWFSSLKINFKLILARFQEKSEVQPTSIRIALGWLTL